MKKSLSLLLILTLAFTLLCGCGSKGSSKSGEVINDSSNHERQLADIDEASTEKTDEKFYQVQVDINPSLTLSFDEDGYIIYAYANNDDAKNLLQNVDLIGLSIEDAVVSASLKAYELGYDVDDFDVDISNTNSGHAVENAAIVSNAVQSAFKTINQYIPVEINDEISGSSLIGATATTDKNIEQFFEEEYDDMYRAELAGYIANIRVEGVPKTCSECGGAGTIVCPTCGGSCTGGASSGTSNQIPCSTCGGSGSVSQWITCGLCGGTGLDYSNMQALDGSPGLCPRCNNHQTGDDANPGCERNPRYDASVGGCGDCGGTGYVTVEATASKCPTCMDPYGESVGFISCSTCGGCGEEYVTEYVTDWVSLEYYQMMINEGIEVEILDEYYD